MSCTAGQAAAGLPSSPASNASNDPQGHEFMRVRAGQPERCGHCDLLLSAFIDSEKTIPCPVPPELRPTEEPEPDVSDTYATYQADKLFAVKFFKTEDHANAFLRDDAGYGISNEDQRWRGPIPVHSPDKPGGQRFDWQLLNMKEIPWRQALTLRQKIGITLKGLDPTPTCFLRGFRVIGADASRRPGHQYEGSVRVIEDVVPRLFEVALDLLSALKCQFPKASRHAVADLMTSLNVFRHLAETGKEMVDDLDDEKVDDLDSLQDNSVRYGGELPGNRLDSALDFVLRHLASQAHEIRSEAQMQCSDAATPPGGKCGHPVSREWSRKLRTLRANAKLSRPALVIKLRAKRVSITSEAVKKHEEGKAYPQPKIRKAYADTYGQPLDALFSHEP
jgi:DNA-binding XRE family transcriptional regulator